MVGFSTAIGVAVRLRWRIDQCYVGFIGVVIFFGLCQILCAPAGSMAFWVVMVGYAGRYVHELLTAVPGRVPTPGLLVPAIAALIAFSFSLGHLPLELYTWSSNGLAAALCVSLVLSARRPLTAGAESVQKRHHGEHGEPEKREEQVERAAEIGARPHAAESVADVRVDESARDYAEKGSDHEGGQRYAGQGCVGSDRVSS